MKYVYMLQSIPFPQRYYVGSSVDLKTRIKEHNLGHSLHTKKFLPWKLVGYTAFSNHKKADRFENEISFRSRLCKAALLDSTNGHHPFR